MTRVEEYAWQYLGPFFTAPVPDWRPPSVGVIFSRRPEPSGFLAVRAARGDLTLAGGPGTHPDQEPSLDADQGTEAGHHREVQDPRRRFRVTGGADRPPHRKDQLPHRALQGSQARPCFAAGSPAHGRSAPPPARLLEGHEGRAVSKSREGSGTSSLGNPGDMRRGPTRGRVLLGRGGPPSDPRGVARSAGWTATGKAPVACERTGRGMAEHKVTVDMGGKELTISTGKWAKLAGGSAVVQLGGTIVLVASSAAKTAKPGLDFVPLTCDYRERTYAAGKIPGGFFKREGRPTEKETLSSRQIDRPIRPLLHKQWTYETQVMATVVSSDQEHDADVLALIGGSTSLMLSSRQIDRPIRPLLHKQWTNETQVMATVVSSDQEHDADVLALIGGSTPLM